MTFNVGDKLFYLGEVHGKEKYECVVVSNANPKFPTVQFVSTGHKLCARPAGYCFGNFNFGVSSYAFAGPPLTPKEKVLQRIKHLEDRFKAKTLRKVKVQALPLGG